MQLLKQASTKLGMLAVLAQQTIPDPGPLPIYPGRPTLQRLFTAVVQWILIIAGIIAVLYLLYGGFQYLTAGGDAERVTKAKTTIINAGIGIIVIALAFAIYFAVTQFITTI